MEIRSCGTNRTSNFAAFRGIHNRTLEVWGSIPTAPPGKRNRSAAMRAVFVLGTRCKTVPQLGSPHQSAVRCYSAAHVPARTSLTRPSRRQELRDLLHQISIDLN